MNYLVQYFVAITLCLSGKQIYAGAEATSSSTIPYFLGYYPDDIGIRGAPKAFVADLRKLCANSGKVWAYGVPTPFTCKSLRKTKGVDGDYLALKLVSKTTPSNLVKLNPLLFSIHPFPDADWVSMRPTKDQTEELRSAILGKSATYKQAAKSVDRGKFSALLLGDGRMLYVVHWKTVLADHGHASDPYSLVLLKADGAFQFSGVLTGTIKGYVDVNGDHVPEVLVSENCDGWCEYLYSIERNHKILVGISVH